MNSPEVVTISRVAPPNLREETTDSMVGSQRASKRADELAASVNALRAEVLERQRAEQVARGQTEALAKTLDLLAAEPELDSFVGQVLKALTEQLGARFGSFWLQDSIKDAPLLRLEYDHRLMDSGVLPISAEPLHASLQRDAPLKQNGPAPCKTLQVYDDIATAPLEHAYRDELIAKGAKTLLAVPLISGHDFIGVFTLLDTDQRTYRPEELELAQALAQQAVLAIQLTRLADHRRKADVLEERNRIAREIHDTLAQAFSGILLQLRVAQRISSQQPQDAWALIEHVCEIAHEGLAEARRSVWDLQPEAMEYCDVVAALAQHVKRTAANSSANLELRVHGTARELPPSVGMDLVRIGQEAITNAIRHGEAEIVHIDLTFEPRRLVLRIQDSGKGYDVNHQPERVGFGLIGMSQRAERLGGKFTIVSQPGQGTEVAVVAPIEPEVKT
ncbi:MAG TPA: GAF domain-containing sensor histidine kinase [Chthonomonadaceae bacterium]|nr:GAF domain-containing sensor histidine kinase [Chthonomonadaceae bacterium]